LLMCGDYNVSEPMRDLLNELGGDFHQEQSMVIDHSVYDRVLDDGSHTVLAVPSQAFADAIINYHAIFSLNINSNTNRVASASSSLSSSSSSHTTMTTRIATPLLNGSPILYHGVGHTISQSPRHWMKLLSGLPSSTYSYYSHSLSSLSSSSSSSSKSSSASSSTDVQEYPESTGGDTCLVTAIQSRNNGRIIISGSMSLFSNAFINAHVHAYDTVTQHLTHYNYSSNFIFIDAVSSWLTHQKAVIKAENLTHHLHITQVNDNNAIVINPASYRIGDDISFRVVLSEFSGSCNCWLPFIEDNVQVELVMIDPYIRATLKNTGSGVYTARLRVPDVAGVYKFRVSYNDYAYSSLLIEHQVAVHPYQHDQFERFILAALPYYVTVATTMAAFATISIIFLYQPQG